MNICKVHLSSNSIILLQKRYLKKNSAGEVIETPEELIERVCENLSAVEKTKEKQLLWKQRFQELLGKLYFLPNSPTLVNAGMPHGQLSACFVLPLGAGYDTELILKYAVQIQRSGGGTGFNFSELPHGNQTGSGCNIISVLEKFNHEIKQVKSTTGRSGANMAILNVDHPCIIEFIRSKKNSDNIDCFNISVGINDEFMKALESGDFIWLRNPGDRHPVKQIAAAEIWNELTDAAWRTGDPGIIFRDTIEKHNPTPVIGTLKATNPCGEVPLLDFEACNLGSINLARMTGNNDGKFFVEWEKLKSVIPVCIRLLDNVIDSNYYDISEIEQQVKGNRKIGLGVMGWADLLVLLEIPYESDEAVQLGERLMKFIRKESLKASENLAEEKGCFPNWHNSIYYPDTPLRNATVNSIAPTGSVAIIADASNSIEPYFALSFTRKNILDGSELYELNPYLEKFLAGKKSTAELQEEIRHRGFIDNNDPLPESVKSLFKISSQISPGYHLLHQSAFQKYTDNAVSKTINLPRDASAGDVDMIFRQAWKLGLKGITVYRYGSRDRQILYLGDIPESNFSKHGKCGC